MTGSVAAILLGLGSIVFLTRMVFMDARSLKSDAERKLWNKWFSLCCIGVLILLLMPGLLEIVGLAPKGSLVSAGAVLFFLIVVRSGERYCQRLSAARIRGQLELRCTKFRSRTTTDDEQEAT